MPEPVKVRLRGTTLQRRRMSGRTMMIGGMALFLVVILASPLQTYLSRRGSVAASERQAQQLSARVAQLQHETAQWNDPAFVERQARVRLQYIRPGDTLYSVLNADGTPRTPEQPASVGQSVVSTRQANWNTKLWASVLAADAAK